MKVVNSLDDYALMCKCGSVNFSLLKSSLIECNKCGTQLEKTMYWTEKELSDAFERIRAREADKNVWIRLKSSELHAKSSNPDFLRGAKWAEATLKGKRREHLKQFEDKEDKFCDNNCVWTDHHPECVYTNDTSEERVDKTCENVHEPEWYYVIDVHGCNRFYHRTEDCPYKVKTPLYTTPQQRPSRSDIKPLTAEQIKGLVFDAGYIQAEETADFINGIRHGEAAHGIKE